MRRLEKLNMRFNLFCLKIGEIHGGGGGSIILG